MGLDIAIIGAGLGGTALALELCSLPNAKCTIYEIRSEGYEQGQHISLAPNALRVLDRLGLLEKLKTVGFSYEKLDFRNASGSLIATFSNGSVKDYGYPAMRLHRQQVHQALGEECKAKGVDIRYGMHLKEIKEQTGQDRVDLVFSNGEKVQADFVVGADGLHSMVREYVTPASTSLYAHMLGITGYLKRDQLHSSVANVKLPSHFVGSTGFMAIMPSNTSGDEVGFFSTMEFDQEKTRAEWDELFHDKNQIRGILKEHFTEEHGWSPLISQICETAGDSSLSSWPFFVAPPMTSWLSSSNRVVVMGDAAHAMIPTGGLGASLAFEDAECLMHAFKHISQSTSPESVLPKVMRAWEAHRKERLVLLKEFTDRNRKIRAAAGNPYVQTLKEWVLWMVLHFVGSDRVAGEIYKYDTAVFERILSSLPQSDIP